MATLGAVDVAPDFALADVAGGVHRLSDALAIGPVVLAFAKSDCGTCVLTFPYLEQLRRIYPGPGWQLFGLFQDSPEDARGFAERLGLTFPVLVDVAPYPVSQLYDPEATPTLLLIQPGGQIARVLAGFWKSELNELAADLASRLGQPQAVVAPAGDDRPAFRPG